MAHDIETFFDERTWTLTYVVYDPASRDAVVIDPVLDYDPRGSKVWTESASRVIGFLEEHDLNLHYVLETHAHADHLSGSQIIKKAFPGARVVIGRNITRVQKAFKMVFDLPDEFPTDGRQFDVLVAAGDVVEAGTLSFSVIETPGHTPACVSYRIGDDVFTGDALFMPDMGTGRCDFPGGSATDLYDSVHEKLYRLGDDVRVWVGHDYQPGGRELKYVATVGEHRAHNVALPDDRSEEDFVAWREARDETLDAPALLFQSVQVNVDAGALPQPEKNAKRYLKIPINAFRPAGDREDIELLEV